MPSQPWFRSSFMSTHVLWRCCFPNHGCIAWKIWLFPTFFFLWVFLGIYLKDFSEMGKLRVKEGQWDWDMTQVWIWVLCASCSYISSACVLSTALTSIHVYDCWLLNQLRKMPVTVGLWRYWIFPYRGDAATNIAVWRLIARPPPPPPQLKKLTWWHLCKCMVCCSKAL